MVYVKFIKSTKLLYSIVHFNSLLKNFLYMNIYPFLLETLHVRDH